jgi:uncharacterized protein YodC (DUF2158 family)
MAEYKGYGRSSSGGNRNGAAFVIGKVVGGGEWRWFDPLSSEREIIEPAKVVPEADKVGRATSAALGWHT